jgi:hypothetical protein
MANFAVIENNTVINIIVAETKEIAETITGLLCIEYTHEKPIYINQKIDEKVFADILNAHNKKITLQELAAQQAAEAEAKRLADQEAQRTAEMGKISNLPKVKGKFVSEGE